jgi:hypothetical protein
MTAVIVPFKPRKAAIKRCAFCGKTEAEAKQMFMGAQACICDECVAISKERADSV